MTEHIESRLSVVESKIQDHSEELDRTRTRLHDLESGWATIRFLVEGLADIRADVKTLLSKSAGDTAVAVYKRWAIATGIAFLAMAAAFLYVAVR